MSIEFLFDEHHEQQQEKLKKILEVVKRKPFKLNKKAWFFNGQEHKSNRAFYGDLNELRIKFGNISIEGVL